MTIGVDLREEQKQELEELASKRGDEDVSPLVQEAVDLFLRQIHDRTEKVRLALAVLGTLDDTAAADLESSVHRLRSTWR
jgi:metal-responsive CopG/Arc/MetJ family transcriptional regulator